jgi:hypothetical protein
LGADEFRAWAADQTLFISSVMTEFVTERQQLAHALEDAGFRVRWFEELGGRDDGAQDAYLSEVAGSTIYIGLLGDQYGVPLSYGPWKGASPTHAEYLEARQAGKRISFWLKTPDRDRDVHARRFQAEVWAFHVTGSFDNGDALVRGVLRRLREIAAEDLTPWVKLGDIAVRASNVRTSRGAVRVHARIYDRRVLSALETAAGQDSPYANPQDLRITYRDRSGTGRIQELTATNSSAAFTDVELSASFEPATASFMSRVATSGMSADDITEALLRKALVGDPLPQALQQGWYQSMEDPWADLDGLPLAEDSVNALARLLLVEALVGTGSAGSIHTFSLGPLRDDARTVRLTYTEPKVYSNVEPQLRSIEGKRRWG